MQLTIFDVEVCNCGYPEWYKNRFGSYGYLHYGECIDCWKPLSQEQVDKFLKGRPENDWIKGKFRWLGYIVN